ncbi:acyl-CoA transferase [Mycobacterium scrofulaceum]|uniref:CoA transferase n=1 Tax=Mycobacterium scrofulaceum TaxID=1783 RepID=UPI0007FEF29F|nr:CoA transferase [Mycobacterium scrofulaceum]OBH74654.1 acyl-CoA transferase [Mycobacterium scrofulaceum]
MGGVSSAASTWGSSGLAYLTGLPDGPPDFSRANVLPQAQRVAAAVGERLGVAIDAAGLLAGRAALLGLTRGGRVSAGGATRLLVAADGWCAITLSRPDDAAAVPALVQTDDAVPDPWPALRRWAATHPRSAVVERANLLDIPAAALGEAAAAAPRIRPRGARGPARGVGGLLVADLSSMWAGPLCGQLLALAGATVVKVESPRRPDGTRGGNQAFFDWMNGEKHSYCVDFDDHVGALRALLTAADIVIEGSRPAALTRRRLGPDDIEPGEGRIWLRVKAYDGARPGFGDDAAVAGGLVGVAADGPVFCADAIADPLTGLEATRVVADSLGRGGGELIEVSMAAVAAGYAVLPTQASVSNLPAPPPRVPPAARPAAPLGADNEAVRRMVAERSCGRC